MQQVVDNQVRMDPKAQERMANATPDQRAMGNKIALGITEGVFAAGPVVGMIFVSILSVGLMATINFGFGGRAKFGSVFALFYYAWLPQIIKPILGTIVIYSGMAPESFNIKNYAPTNLGAFLDPVDTNKALYTLATSLDAVTIWTLVLLGIGVATVAGTKRSSGYIAVFGWWALFVLIGVGIAAMTRLASQSAQRVSVVSESAARCNYGQIGWRSGARTNEGCGHLRQKQIRREGGTSRSHRVGTPTMR